MGDFRKIVSLEGIGPCPDPGAAPEVIYPELGQLVVNEEYQRQLSGASLRQIKKMALNWDWGSFKAPNVARTDQENVYEIVDGQHTAIAAATNGNIFILPCLLSNSSSVRDKAKNFLGINQTKIALTQAAIYNAELAAGDDVATAIQIAMNRTNVRLLAVPPNNGVYSPGDTMAIGTLKGIARTRGGVRLRKLLAISKAGDAVPISSALLKALDVCLPRDSTQEQEDLLAKIIKGQTAARLEMIAKSRTNKGSRAYETLADMLSDFAKFPVKRAGIRK